MLRIAIWSATLLLVLAWAAWRGGRDERLTALALVLADAGARLHRPSPGWHDLDLVSVSLDLALLAFLFHRAMVTTRWWPIYACAAQICASFGLVGYAISALHLPAIYNVNGVLWSYVILASLSAGVALEQERVREERAGRI